MRGLKHDNYDAIEVPFTSHPVRVRGLKLLRLSHTWMPIRVAPRTGAWIETLYIELEYKDVVVAPRTGAWIETSFLKRKLKLQVSRTPYGCVD